MDSERQKTMCPAEHFISFLQKFYEENKFQ